MAQRVVREKAIPIRLACEAFRVSESCYRYEAKNNAENELIANWLIRLTDNNRNWVFGLCYLYLRNIKNFTWNHKRIYRITTKGSPFRDKGIGLNYVSNPASTTI